MKQSYLSLLIPALFASMKMAESSQATILDLDAMMDESMESIETLPDFVNPPAGNYTLTVNDCKVEKYTPKPSQETPRPTEQARIKIIYAVDRTIQLGNPRDLPVKDGSLFSESFMVSEDGKKFFKRQAMNIMNVSDLAGATLKDVITGLKGTQFNAAITVVKTPNPSGGQYENVRVRPVHEAK